MTLNTADLEDVGTRRLRVGFFCAARIIERVPEIAGLIMVFGMVEPDDDSVDNGY